MKKVIAIVCLAAVAAGSVSLLMSRDHAEAPPPIQYKPRTLMDSGGFYVSYDHMPPFTPDMSVEDCAKEQKRTNDDYMEYLETQIEANVSPIHKPMMMKALMLHSRGNAEGAYKVLKDLEARVRGTDLEAETLYTIIHAQGIAAMRMGENDNCVHCRGESACIFPISKSAIHANPTGSRLAIQHFTEYLRVFPDDLEVKWSLNLAHMTLGEHPHKVDARYLLTFDAFAKNEFDLGAFRDISHKIGLMRHNQSGGMIVDDFDNDGLFDVVVTDWGFGGPMAYYRNTGDGTFEERTKEAGLERLASGLFCVQTDYNNDGWLDIFIPRGAWQKPQHPIRPSLLRNNGNGTFTDVTAEAGLTKPFCSNSASWADFDNDGHLDLFMTGNGHTCPLYRNKGDGTFEDVRAKAGLPAELNAVLGSAWIDYDNDSYPDLFVNMGNGPGGPPGGTARLFHNNRNGTFTETTKEMGIDGPSRGFSCWAFDFDNDGWMDILALTIDHTLEGVAQGILEQPHTLARAKLYRNINGKRFENIAAEAGLEKCYSPMGSNFGDLDNDGYLDFYLGTGDPNLETLIPNRMFKNVGGKRFSEITASSRTGHLQKGHGIAFADWRRCGYLDVFSQLGGAVKGDSYHNVVFQNPGRGSNWISIKCVGAKTNTAAIGARIKVVTAGPEPQTIHRHVTSGSSFGANPLEQHFGLGKAARVARVEVFWPVSGTTQVFTDIDVNQGLVIQELDPKLRTRSWKPIAVPE